MCDKHSCQDSYTCEGDRCAAGYLISSPSQLRQRCVSNDFQLVDSCGKNIDGWSEVCACEHDRCNSYAAFVSMMDQFNEISTDVHRIHGDTVREIRRNQSSTLIILLVILPLSVGGLAVCLIFVNYHCKMC
uniref:Protein sleepless n=1 Tax=Syphacia muris TaxID=451379 RepID=A0A0N5APN2_9BILA